MKISNYIFFTVFLVTTLFVISVRNLSKSSLNHLEKNFNIAVSLSGEASSPVVADRIAAIDGVKEVKILTSAEIFKDFRKDEIMSKKIMLEENPFFDYLIVYPDSLKTDISVLVEKIKMTGGVGNVIYDVSVKKIFRVIYFLDKSALGVIGMLIIFLTTHYLGLIRLKISHGDSIWKMDFNSAVFMFLAILSFVVNNVFCVGLGIKCNHMIAGIFVFVLALFASLAYAE